MLKKENINNMFGGTGSTVSFSDAEIGDEFYYVVHDRYNGRPRSVAKYTVAKVGKRDVVCTKNAYPQQEIRVSRKNPEHNVYLDRAEVQPIIDTVRIVRKRAEARNYIDANAGSLPEDICDIILNYARAVAVAEQNATTPDSEKGIRSTPRP